MNAREGDELRWWRRARAALAEGVAFLDGEGRVLDCDARFVELLGALLRQPVAGPEALLERHLHEQFEGQGYARVRELLDAELEGGQTHRVLVPGVGFALRIAALERPVGGRVVVLHELQTPAVDEDVGFLREQLGVRDEMLAAQQLLIRELMAPSIPLTPTLVVVPFVGPFHYDRVEEVLARLLVRAREHGTRTMVIDLTGASHFDGSTSAALERMHGTLALLGVDMVVTGVGVELSLTLGEDDWSPAFEIHASLQDALARHLDGAQRSG